jgi:polyhydroxyalkanoate synthesis regulator phasin
MNPTLLRLTLKPALALALTAAAWPVAAQTSDIEAVRAATAKLIAQLVDQGVLAPDKGEALLTEVIRPAAAS